MIRQRIAGEAVQSFQPKFQNLFPRSPNRLVILRLDSALNAFKASPASVTLQNRVDLARSDTRQQEDGCHTCHLFGKVVTLSQD
jgi:hypothetical protein